MKKLSVFLFTLISISVFAQETIINDKNAQVRSIQGFNGIKVSGAIDVYLSQSNSEAVAVSASEDKYRDKIRTEVVNGILKIYYDGDRLSLSISNKKLKAYISFKDLVALDASGASSFKISGSVNSSNLKVTLTGASDMQGNVKISDLLTIEANGASNAKLSGAVKTINIVASGASDVKGYELSVDNCTVKATGASDIHLTVNKEISAHASGASSVFYKGEAVMKEVHSNGASSVAKKG